MKIERVVRLAGAALVHSEGTRAVHARDGMMADSAVAVTA